MYRIILTYMLTATIICFQADLSADVLREKITLGNEYYRQENYSQALEAYDQAKAETQDQTLLDYNRANCFYQMDDYDQAMELYRQVSADSKDMDLVKRAKFNLGNCHYRKGMKHKDSNLETTLEQFEHSVSYYRKVLDLEPDDKDARKNIAVVRLQMKHIMDTLQKRKEMEQKEKDLFEKLKELPDEQMELLGQTAQLMQNMADPNRPTTVEKTRLLRVAGEQNDLKEKTGAVLQESRLLLEQMQSQRDEQGQPLPIQDPCAIKTMEILATVNKELPASITHQDEAARYMNQGLTPRAAGEQYQSWETLKRALEAFPKKKSPQDQQQQQNQQENQDNQQQQQDQQSGTDPQKEIQQAVVPDATAREILEDERELQKKRARRAQPGGRFSTSGKDW